MSDLNVVLVIGRITKGPFHKVIPSGVPVCDFTIAINKRWNDSQGKRKESTDFVPIVCWSNLADRVAKNIKQGETVLVEGRLKYTSWQTKDSERRSQIKVLATKVTPVWEKQEIDMDAEIPEPPRMRITDGEDPDPPF